MKDGHTVTIASHPEYRGWAEGYGLGYREIGGDPSVLMELNVKHKMLVPSLSLSLLPDQSVSLPRFRNISLFGS